MDVFATYWQRLTRIVGWDDAAISGGIGDGSSRAMLATARPSCYWLMKARLQQRTCSSIAMTTTVTTGDNEDDGAMIVEMSSRSIAAGASSSIFSSRTRQNRRQQFDHVANTCRHIYTREVSLIVNVFTRSWIHIQTHWFSGKRQSEVIINSSYLFTINGSMKRKNKMLFRLPLPATTMHGKFVSVFWNLN